MRQPSPALRAEVAELLETVGTDAGDPALSEHKRMVLARDQWTASGAFGVTARATGSGRLLGYAQVGGDRAGNEYAMELVDGSRRHPTAGTTAPAMGTVGDLLIDAARGHLTEVGGGRLRLWVPRATDADDARAARHGFAHERDLFQMRCRLPLPPEGHRTVTVATRPFRPGADEAAWLEVNNRSFAAHPEQGRWDLATLREREREPWFDPDGFLVLESDGRMAGSCWTKVHVDTDPPMGEIYVIGVDPEFHGRGWGRALTRAGLDWLAGRGLTVGLLYVDASNLAAVTLYRSLGFVEDRVDRSYVLDVPARRQQ